MGVLVRGWGDVASRCPAHSSANGAKWTCSVRNRNPLAPPTSEGGKPPGNCTGAASVSRGSKPTSSPAANSVPPDSHPPPLDNCSKFSAKSDSRSPANPGVLHAAFAVRAPGCRVPCWPMLPPSNGSGTRPNSSDNSMSCKKQKFYLLFFPLQHPTAATSVACFYLGPTTLRITKKEACTHSDLG